MSSLGSLSKSSNSLPADKGSELNKQGSAKKKAKKLPIKISKWIKRIFKHI
jgi:hypothetical protein